MAAAGHDSGPRIKRSQTTSRGGEGNATSVCVKRVTFSPAPPPLSQLTSSNTSTTTKSMMMPSSTGLRQKTSSTSSTSSIAQSSPVAMRKKRKSRLAKSTADTSRPLLEKSKRKKSKRVWPTKNMATVEPDGGHQLPSECPDFGVKSYLHHFYENVAVKNPDQYEELQGSTDVAGFGRSAYRYLMEPPKKLKCRSLWWKLAVWSGVFILVVGVAVILVGYLLPRRPVVIAGLSGSLEVVDRAAVRYNANLDTSKLVGLIVFCVGGALVAVALLIPSFFYNYCDEEWSGDSGSEPPFKVRTESHDGDDEEDDDDDSDDENESIPAVLSPTEKRVPVTEELMKIQPEWGTEDVLAADKSWVGSREELIVTDCQH